MMKNRPIILFPHSYLPGAARDTLLSSFDAITVCQPWYMASATGTDTYDSRIAIVWPPEDLKPPEDFKKLLAEYRLWMAQNPGYAPLPIRQEGDATWEIRESLRQTGGQLHESLQEQSLKWHLILHLERELEEDRTSADDMLLRVKGATSPLAEALGETNPSQGFFDDLHLPDGRFSIEERHLRQVLGAWFGLFGQSLPENGILLTLSPDVVTYAAELFETAPPGPSSEEDALSLRTIDLPRTSVDSPMKNDRVRAGLSGKTLVLMNGR